MDDEFPDEITIDGVKLTGQSATVGDTKHYVSNFYTNKNSFEEDLKKVMDETKLKVVDHIQIFQKQTQGGDFKGVFYINVDKMDADTLGKFKNKINSRPAGGGRKRRRKTKRKKSTKKRRTKKRKSSKRKSKRRR